jgi:hypothetical protein
VTDNKLEIAVSSCISDNSHFSKHLNYMSGTGILRLNSDTTLEIFDDGSRLDV